MLQGTDEFFYFSCNLNFRFEPSYFGYLYLGWDGGNVVELDGLLFPCCPLQPAVIGGPGDVVGLAGFGNGQATFPDAIKDYLLGIVVVMFSHLFLLPGIFTWEEAGDNQTGAALPG